MIWYISNLSGEEVALEILLTYNNLSFLSDQVPHPETLTGVPLFAPRLSDS